MSPWDNFFKSTKRIFGLMNKEIITILFSKYVICSDFLYSDFDGLFLSNGPGDPQMCETAIANIRSLINTPNLKPVFGICLGHQLLSLAAGASTYKMK